MRASLISIIFATVISILLNCAPHGELLSADRLIWVAASLFLYSILVILFVALPVALLFRKLNITNLLFYLLAGILIPCLSYTLTFWLNQGELWLGGMTGGLAYNALVGLLVAPIFRFYEINGSK